MPETRVSKVRALEQCANLRSLRQGRNSENRSPSESVQRCNGLVDGSCSSDSSGSFSSLKAASVRCRKKQGGEKCVRGSPDSSELPVSQPSLEKKRCGWITASSHPSYVSFHDEEWGVPLYDDRKFFELLVLSEALGDLSWPTIINNRERFRKLFDSYDPASVANFSEKKMQSLIASGSILLSEPKLRAVVENAKQILKVTEEFGSFSNYCWRFVNHKPIINGYRYARQVPVKTSKAEAISKDMMRRGFRCVGPTVVYSFMQAGGIVNDHLSTCFRYRECHSDIKKDCAAEVEEVGKLVKSTEQVCLLQA